MFSFLKKKLAVDTSAEEIRRITTILEQNQVKFEIRTTRPRGTLGSASDARTYGSANLSMYKGAPQQVFVYTVYVHPKDYEKARRLVWGG